MEIEKVLCHMDHTIQFLITCVLIVLKQETAEGLKR